MTTPWHENEAFWDQMADVMFGSSRWEQAPGDVEKIIKLIDLTPGSAVLDLPCGPGRHALEFARRGFAVTGVDITPRYLEEAKRRANDESLSLALSLEDMRRFSRPEQFDLVVNLFTSFGYFRDPADEQRTARNFLESLRPGGRLVMDMMGREVAARLFREREWTEFDDGGVLLEHREIIDDWSWNRSRWIYLRDGIRHEHSFEVRLYTATQLIERLTEVGFVKVIAHGNLEGAPYDHQAERLVIIAQRPE